MRDTVRKLSGVALGVPEPVTIETTVTLPRPGRQASTRFARPTSMYPLASVDVDGDAAPAPQKVFDPDAAIRRFDDIPTVNRDNVPFTRLRLAAGSGPSMPAPPVSARVEPERPRCVLPQEVDVRYALEAMRRAR